MIASQCRGHGPTFTNSGRGAVVVVQHAAQTLAPLDLTWVIEVVRFWADELVRQALMVALSVIMGDEILNGSLRFRKSRER